MILAVDVGNSSILLGCMDGLAVRHTMRLKTDRTMCAAQYFAALQALLAQNGYPAARFEGAILSSVVAAVTAPLRQALSSLFCGAVLVVGETAKTMIPLRIDHPESIGADLIAAAEGALAQYKPPLILIDMGTATTFSVLDQSGAFLGGAIAPGLQLSAEALAQRTGLPLSDLLPPHSALGADTVDCLRSGTVLGAAAMVDGMLDRLEAALGMPAPAIATGGLAGYVIPYCQHRILLGEALLLRGLVVMYRRDPPPSSTSESIPV